MKELLTPDEYAELRVRQAYPTQPYQVGEITSSTYGLYDTDSGVQLKDCIILDGKPHTTKNIDVQGYQEYLPDVVFSPAWSSYVLLSEFTKLCGFVGFNPFPSFIPQHRCDCNRFFQTFALRCLESRHKIIHNEDDNMDKVVSKLLGQYSDYGLIFLLKD
jgi:hypothetical protein